VQRYKKKITSDSPAKQKQKSNVTSIGNSKRSFKTERTQTWAEEGIHQTVAIIDMVIKNGTTKTDSQNTQQQQIPQQQQQQKQSPESHSVILVTAGYDNTIRFWEALSGICSRTIQHPNSVSNSKESGSHEVHILFTMEIIASE
jgi:methylphosphotriester-DNA--protein-cysteine methyltransferase